MLLMVSYVRLVCIRAAVILAELHRAVYEHGIPVQLKEKTLNVMIWRMEVLGVRGLANEFDNFSIFILMSIEIGVFHTSINLPTVTN